MENDALPQYMRIARSIAQRIADGELQEGEKLSGRSKLSSEYNVSPETIRKAVQVLQDRAGRQRARAERRIRAFCRAGAPVPRQLQRRRRSDRQKASAAAASGAAAGARAGTAGALQQYFRRDDSARAGGAEPSQLLRPYPRGLGRRGKKASER